MAYQTMILPPQPEQTGPAVPNVLKNIFKPQLRAASDLTVSCGSRQACVFSEHACKAIY